MSILNGCQEGKATPMLVEAACPRCGELMEIFVRMGGEIGRTGRLVEKSICEKCGYEAEADTDAGLFRAAGRAETAGEGERR